MKIIIVGGGTAGWMCAYYILNAQPGQHEVTVIESSTIGIIGAGEGTTGWMKDLISGHYFPCSNDIDDFMIKTDATRKMGIYHRFWNKHKKEYFAPIDGSFTYDHSNDHIFKYVLYKFGYEKFHVASPIGLNFENKNFTDIDAFHLDGHKVGQYFKSKCIDNHNIKIIDSIVKKVEIDSNENIKSLTLEQGFSVDGDFFIDCTGFKRILMEAVNSKWISYKKFLPVDSAMPFIIRYEKDNKVKPLPMTTATALSSGWMWDIPLTTRRGCGYVFDSNFLTKEQAKQEIENHLNMEIEPIKFIDFTSGKGDCFWKNNVLSLGLASCFVEPLEATSIHSTIVQIKSFVDQFLCQNAKNTIHKHSQDSYNAYVSNLYEYIFNFISLHYQGGREDSEFWQYIKNENVITDFTRNILEISKYKIIGSTLFENAAPGAPGAALWNWVLTGLGYNTPETAKTELLNNNLLELAEKQWGHIHKHVDLNYKKYIYYRKFIQ